MNNTNETAGVCVGCPNGCDVCTSATACTTCSSRYFMTPSNTCGPCPVGCLTCSFNVGTGYTCLTCQPDYYLNLGVCVQCQSPCIDCTALTTCQSCL